MNFECDNTCELKCSNFKVINTGTTTTEGIGLLILGNSIVKGSNGNSTGKLQLYGTSSGYTQIQAGNNTTSNITLTLPDTTGTIPVVSLSGTTLTITT